MKAIHVHRFVSDFNSINNSHMTMEEKVPLPTIGKGQMLVQVSACSISPGDVLMVRGNVMFMHKPFPFVPGMDICGIVQDDPSGRFQKGDVIVASNGYSPVGGLAEYMAVNVQEAVLKPDSVRIPEAAASSSAITARNAILDHVRPGDRVLVLGGSGGVGSAAIQLAKHRAKASLVVTTSTQESFCQQLGADHVINYQIENWWEMKQYQDDNKFDVIVDCVGGGNFHDRATNVLKPGREGGVFVAVTGDDTNPDCRTVWKVIRFFLHLAWLPWYASFHRHLLPKYVLIMPHHIPQGRAQVLQWMAEGQLKIPLEPEYEFTEAGVRAAFSKVGTGHAHGKVVITM